jgi:acylpyruvate hydrolase
VCVCLCGLLMRSSAGTPEGVGPVRIGQKIKAGITGIIEAEFDVQRRSRTFSA